MRKSIVLFTFMFSSLTLAFSQETHNYTDLINPVVEAQDLIDQKNYLEAKRLLENWLNNEAPAEHNQMALYRSKANFIIAQAAFYLQDPEAEYLLLKYIEAEYETLERRLAYFYLGSLYYRNKSYSEAIDWLKKVKTTDLDNNQLVDHKFKLAYSLFVRKQLDQARPLFKQLKAVNGEYQIPASYYYAFINFYDGNYKEAKKGFEQSKNAERFKDVVPFYLIQIYFFEEDYVKVISYGEKLVDKQSFDYKLEVYQLIGQAHYKQGSYQKAIEYLSVYVDQSKKVKTSDVYQLAYSKYMSGDYLQAIEHFKELDRQKTEIGQYALYYMAECYLRIGNKAAARNAFQQAKQLNFDLDIKESSAFNFAKLSYDLDFHKIAVSALGDFLEDYPSSAYKREATEMLANALLTSKNYVAAIKVLEHNDTQTPKLKQAYQRVTYYRAIELYNDKKYDLALTHIDKSLKTPIDIKYKALTFFLKGEVLYRLEKYKSAKIAYSNYIEFSKIAKIESKVTTPFKANYNIGYCAYKLNEHDKAIVYFKEAINLYKYSKDEDKDNIINDARLRLADNYFLVKSYGEALSAYRNAAERNVSTDYAMLQMGIIYGLQDQRQAQITTLNEMLKLPNNSSYKDEAWYELGKAYQAKGDFQAAINAFSNLKNAFINSRNRSDAMLRMGLMYYNLGQSNEAIAIYKEVAQSYNSSKQANEALKVMKEIYVAEGRANEYISFIQNDVGLDISATAQDSLLYQSAEEAYLRGDCNAAIDRFGNYLRVFDAGLFVLQAHFYRAECLDKADRKDLAHTDYVFVANDELNKFREKALFKTAVYSYYTLNDYPAAYQYYKDLLEVAETKNNHYVALKGLARTSFKLNRLDESIDYAQRLIADDQASKEELIEAHFYLAKSQMEFGKFALATQAFNYVQQSSNSVMGAESLYRIALINHEEGNYQASLDDCFLLKDKFASYERWVVMGFLLISDNYLAMDNAFQAKATLNSIINNYKGERAILNSAQQKLDAILELEAKNSKVDDNYFENDSIIKMEEKD